MSTVGVKKITVIVSLVLALGAWAGLVAQTGKDKDGPPAIAKKTGIQGTLFIVTKGGSAQFEPPQGPPRPFPNCGIAVYSLKGGKRSEKPIASLKTDKDGKFQVELPAGTYVVQAQYSPSPSEQKVVVKGGELSEVKLTVDSGVR